MYQREVENRFADALKILVTTAYPREEIRREGMMQRIFEIDQILKDRFYVNYLSVGIKKNRRVCAEKVAENIKEKRCNFFMHQNIIWKEVRNADVIYVHAITTFILFMLPILIFRKKFVLDVHGVVPEESILYGKPFAAFLYSLVEKIAILRSSGIIVVTKSMQRHLEAKYPRSVKKYVYLPIFNDLFYDKPKRSGKLKVIYAGGRQPWQRVDLMVDFIRSTYKIYEFEIYTSKSDLEDFKSDLLGIDIKIETLSKDDLVERYKDADLGIIFRDDITVNNVANPTKLNEYIAMGIVPIMTSNQIGDFEEMRYEYVSFSDGLEGVDKDKLHEMSQFNSSIYLRSLGAIQDGKNKVIDLIMDER